MYTKLLKLSVAIYLTFLILACENTSIKAAPLIYSGAIMGTSFSIKANQLPKGIKVEPLQKLIKIRLDEINQSMSTYLDDSELSLINNTQTLKIQAVSAELFKVLTTAKEISHKSAGAFDITVAPLVNLWGFGSDGMRFQAPEKTKVQELLAKTGDQYYSLHSEGVSIQKIQKDLSLDLSALAKGYAVDQVALLLERHGIQNYLVEIGGELRLKGHNNQGKKWRIAIEKPNINQRELYKILTITNIAMATSGDYRNFFEHDGKRFSHTIDPRTGYPITHQLASVTVLHESSMVADAWATALMVLGSEEGYKLAQQEKLVAFFIIKKQQGFAELATPLFTQYTKVRK
jgi:thiamine biosynthesis lipoprotein